MKKILFMTISSLIVFWLFIFLGHSGNLSSYLKSMVGRAAASTTSPQTHNVTLSTTVQAYMVFDFTAGDTVAFGNLTPGTPIDAPATATIASVTTNSLNGYTIGIADATAGTNSSMVNAGSYIADYAGSFATPTLWTGTGLGITLFSGTQKDAKWGTGTTYNDGYNKYAGIPQAAATAHTVTGFHAAADLSSWAWSIDVPNDQKTGAYSGVVTFTATSVLS